MRSNNDFSSSFLQNYEVFFSGTINFCVVNFRIEPFIIPSGQELQQQNNKNNKTLIYSVGKFTNNKIDKHICIKQMKYKNYKINNINIKTIKKAIINI